jgi:hypothetical protein
VYNGTEGKRYENVLDLKMIGDKLAYVAKGEDENFISSWFPVIDEVEQKEYSVQQNLDLYDIGGKLAYAIPNQNTNEAFVVYDGVAGKKYKGISEITAIGNKLAYVIDTNTNTLYNKQILVFEGKEYHDDQEKYQEIKNLTDVQGKLAYILITNPKLITEQALVFFDGKEGKSIKRSKT